jgi:hypothetical protein
MRWRTIVLAAIVGMLVLGCKFEPGKRVTWTSTIDTQFAINVDAGDNLVWSVLPHGGTLPSGVALGINYVYTPR